MYPKERNLDGIYFRVERDGKWLSLCFTDLTREEQEKVTTNYKEENFDRMAKHFEDTIDQIFDYLHPVEKINVQAQLYKLTAKHLNDVLHPEEGDVLSRERVFDYADLLRDIGDGYDIAAEDE